MEGSNGVREELIAKAWQAIILHPGGPRSMEVRDPRG